MSMMFTSVYSVDPRKFLLTKCREELSKRGKVSPDLYKRLVCAEDLPNGKRISSTDIVWGIETEGAEFNVYFHWKSRLDYLNLEQVNEIVTALAVGCGIPLEAFTSAQYKVATTTWYSPEDEDSHNDLCVHFFLNSLG